ncbi:methyltransferase, FkbM family [Niabella drilacis]|uniref:Methyltransferase, FkbM family n=2 Tax=Niabella drilacis (strain DSM 25811 / CCM 8410 / CCUG 62505 / LMG 26954 / E90) TaxID=1285928 RepID=A0A1G6NRV3_NIADE|nr:methyltransferase, FkbM family [Niabella drilacis]
MKDKIIKILRKKKYYKIWAKLMHVSKIGMNYWGGASFVHSGEMLVIDRFLPRLSQQSEVVIFDVGANIGEWSLYAAKMGYSASIYAFEPSKATYDTLVQNTRAYPNIKCVNLGLGDKIGQYTLYSSRQESPIASLYKIDNPVEEYSEKYTQTINISTVENFCQNNNVEEIAFLKIDVEGHEYKALLGAGELIQNGKIRCIQFEFGESHIEARTFFKDFWTLLKCYEFFRILPDGLVRIPAYSADLEIFNTANYLAVLK